MRGAVFHIRPGRTIGIVIAAVLGVAFFGTIAYLVWRARSNTSGPTPPSVTDTPEPIPGLDDLGSSSGSEIELYDRGDPTRLSARILSARTDPVPERRGMVRMEHPEAWAYLKTGQVIHVRANSGLFYMPDRQREPESGTISGDVVVRVFPPPEGGPTGAEPTGEPLATLRTSTLTFDGNSFEVSTPERFEFTGGELTGAGTGLKLIYNEVAQRVELLEIRRGESVTFTPVAASSARPGPPRGSAPTAKPASAGAATVASGSPGARRTIGPAAAAGTAIETFYHVVLSDGVVVTQERRTLRADRLTAWARLLDNRLPEGAIARLDALAARTEAMTSGEAPGSPAGAAPHAQPRPAPVASAPPAAASMTNDPATEPGPVTLAWTGSCVLRPMDAAPPELLGDHVALRATAEISGAVTFDDAALGGTGRCATLDYGLTTGKLAMSGPGPASVVLALEGAPRGGTLEAVRVELDLRALTAAIPSPGVLNTLAGEGADGAHRQASWNERADFVFDRSGGGLRLREAVLLGKVQASNGTASVRGDRVRAEFAAAPNGASQLTRLTAHDPARVLAQSGDDESLRAEDVDVEFGPGVDPSRPDPVRLVAKGRVHVVGRGSDLACGALDARLARDEKGAVVVMTADATEGVVFARKSDGVTARAGSAHADAATEIVTLTGPDTFVGVDDTRIGGGQIRLDGLARTVTVFGPWTIVQGERAPGEDPILAASGESGLTFDDKAGTAEGAGAIVAVHVPDAASRDRMSAERLRLAFSAGRSGVAGDDPATRRTDRTLLRVTAIGAVEEREGGGPATAESRRYTIDPGGARRLIQAVHVEGPRLIANQEEGVLDVPGPGRAVVRDHSARDVAAEEPKPAPAARAAVGGAASGDMRGDSLFTWDRSMRLDRAGGAMEMDGNVWLTHVRLAEDQAVRVIAEHVTARVKTADGSLGGAGGAELSAASARGAVNVAVGPRDPSKPFDREMTADRLEYDAGTGILEAFAEKGNLVTLFDATRGAPTSAEKMVWDLKKNEIRFVRPQPVVIPR